MPVAKDQHGNWVVMMGVGDVAVGSASLQGRKGECEVFFHTATEGHSVGDRVEDAYFDVTPVNTDMVRLVFTDPGSVDVVMRQLGRAKAMMVQGGVLDE